MLQQITEKMIDHYKIFEEGGLEILKWREKKLLFPPRYQLKFTLIDSSVASKNYIINVEFIGTKPAVKTNILLGNPSQYNVN